MNIRFQCLAVAGRLDAGQTLAAIGNAGAVAAFVGGFAGIVPVSSAALALWAMACFYAIRVRMDASFFRALAGAGEHGGEDLDALLTAWALKRRTRSRTIAERTEAAIGLLRWLAILVVLEIGTIAAGFALIWRSL